MKNSSELLGKAKAQMPIMGNRNRKVETSSEMLYGEIKATGLRQWS